METELIDVTLSFKTRPFTPAAVTAGKSTAVSADSNAMLLPEYAAWCCLNVVSCEKHLFLFGGPLSPQRAASGAVGQLDLVVRRCNYMRHRRNPVISLSDTVKDFAVMQLCHLQNALFQYQTSLCSVGLNKTSRCLLFNSQECIYFVPVRKHMHLRLLF